MKNEKLARGLYRRPSGSCFISRTIKGVHYTVGLHETTEAAVHMALAHFELDPSAFVKQRRRSPDALGTQKVAKLIAKYLRELKVANRSPRTIETYKATLDAVSSGMKVIGQWTADFVIEHMAKRVRVLAPSTLAKEAAHCSRFLKWCVMRGFLDESPYDTLPKPTTLQVRMDDEFEMVSPEQIEALRFSYLEAGEVCQPMPDIALTWRAALLALWATALRIGELGRVHEEDIDVANMHLRVRCTPSERSKGRRPRIVPIADEVVLEALFVCARTHIEWGTLRKAIGRECKRMGLPCFKLHDLRHTRISFWAAAGIDVFTIASWAGHRDIKTTLRYCHAYQARTLRPEPTGFTTGHLSTKVASPTKAKRSRCCWCLETKDFTGRGKPVCRNQECRMFRPKEETDEGLHQSVH